MEREILLTGIGGQGVQLAAQVLAHAAILEGRHVLLFGVYGGAMRGMNTDGTVVVGDGPIQTPPIVSHAWSAMAMHDRYWAPVEPKLRDGSLVLVNDTTFDAAVDAGRLRVLRVPATELAASVGNELGGAMVMLGAFVALTGVVGVDAAVDAMRQSLPPYRKQHIAGNEAALRAGAAHVEPLGYPAWA